MTHTELRTQLLERIELLPDSKLEALLSYASYLFFWGLPKQNGHHIGNSDPYPDRLPDHLNPEDDPILKLIGGVEHGSLAQNLDEELYSYESLSGHMGLAHLSDLNAPSNCA